MASHQEWPASMVTNGYKIDALTTEVSMELLMGGGLKKEVLNDDALMQRIEHAACGGGFW